MMERRDGKREFDDSGDFRISEFENLRISGFEGLRI
jgi:hypothetical protein